MKIAETVTFGGSGLDRAAERRKDTATLATQATSRIIPFWRGKPMLAADALVRLAPDHPIFADALVDRVFLGDDDGVLTFAADLSLWTPPELDDAALNTFLDPSEQHLSLIHI